MDAQGARHRVRQVRQRNPCLRERGPRGSPRRRRQAGQRDQGAQEVRSHHQRDQHPPRRGDGRGHHQLRRGTSQKAPAHRQERQAHDHEEAHRGHPRGQGQMERPVPRGNHRVARRRGGGGRPRPRRRVRHPQEVPLLQPRPVAHGRRLDEPRQGRRLRAPLQVVRRGLHRAQQGRAQVHPHGGRPHGHPGSRFRYRPVPRAQLRPPCHHGCGYG